MSIELLTSKVYRPIGTHMSMDISGYRYNHKGFYEKFTYQMFIN